MPMQRIDPKSPGKSTDTDAFKDPYNRSGWLGGQGHANLARDDNGRFSGFMPRGGESPDGEEYQRKYASRGRAPAQAQPQGANLNDDGTGYDPSDVEDVDRGVTVNRNVVKQP